MLELDGFEPGYQSFYAADTDGKILGFGRIAILRLEILQLIQKLVYILFCVQPKHYCFKDIFGDFFANFFYLLILSTFVLNRLKDFESEYDNLAEAEQFAISISGIKRLVPRLKSLKFQQTYPELVQECKPHIVSATAACEEVKKSKKFARILELILLFGKIISDIYF